MKLIAAVALDGAIGTKEGRLPWRNPKDLQQFRRKTMGKTCLIGWKTYAKLPRKLDGRKLIVLTRDEELAFTKRDGVEFTTWAELIKQGRLDEIDYVIGGAQIYSLVKDFVTEMDITVHELFAGEEGGAYFPWQDYGHMRPADATPHEYTVEGLSFYTITFRPEG